MSVSELPGIPGTFSAIVVSVALPFPFNSSSGETLFTTDNTPKINKKTKLAILLLQLQLRNFLKTRPCENYICYSFYINTSYSMIFSPLYYFDI